MACSQANDRMNEQPPRAALAFAPPARRGEGIKPDLLLKSKRANRDLSRGSADGVGGPFHFPELTSIRQVLQPRVFT